MIPAGQTKLNKVKVANDFLIHRQRFQTIARRHSRRTKVPCLPTTFMRLLGLAWGIVLGWFQRIFRLQEDPQWALDHWPEPLLPAVLSIAS